MAIERRKYTEEFKHEAVGLTESSGKPSPSLPVIWGKLAAVSVCQKSDQQSAFSTQPKTKAKTRCQKPMGGIGRWAELGAKVKVVKVKVKMA